jgi:PKD repeat protein
MEHRNNFRLLIVLGCGLLAAACKSGSPASGPPQAELDAAPRSGMAPLTVEFDASGSFDPGGDIVNYAWDWDGNGTTDDTTAGPVIEHTYAAAGNFNARVTVTDDEGETDTASVQIRALEGNWTVQPLDVVGNVGAFTSAAMINGRPAIAYSDETNQRQKFVIAANAAGTAWGIPLTVNLDENGGFLGSLAEIGDRPAIAYVNDVLNRVMYVRALDSSGNTWSDPEPLGLPSTITDLRLREVDDLPAVAFVDEGSASNGEAVFIRAFDANGASWDNGILVDDVGEDVGAIDMTIVNGVPGVLYSEEASRDLRFVQARDRRGDEWFLPVDAVNSGSVGNMVSVAVVDGVPAASYLETSSAQANLFYAQSQDIDGVDWRAPVGVDISVNSSGQHNSLAVVGGVPAIAYYNLTQGRLEYVQAEDEDGDSWGTPTVVDEGAATGQFLSLVDVNGAPGISYYEATNGDLMWAVLE